MAIKSSVKKITMLITFASLGFQASMASAGTLHCPDVFGIHGASMGYSVINKGTTSQQVNVQLRPWSPTTCVSGAVTLYDGKGKQIDYPWEIRSKMTCGENKTWTVPYPSPPARSYDVACSVNYR